MSVFVFCEFFLNEKSEVKFFRLKRSALKRGIQRCRIHCHSMFNEGAMAVLMFFRGANSIEGGGTWFFGKKILSRIRTKLR
jgi:hypothetical protein